MSFPSYFPFPFHVENVPRCKNGPRACIYASVHVYMYVDKVCRAVFTWFHAFVGVCLHVYEGVCAWKQDKMRNSGVSAVAVVHPGPVHLTNNQDWTPITDAADLQFNILVGKCDEYLTLICSREQCMFINVGWGR